ERLHLRHRAHDGVHFLGGRDQHCPEPLTDGWIEGLESALVAVARMRAAYPGPMPLALWLSCFGPARDGSPPAVPEAPLQPRLADIAAARSPRPASAPGARGGRGGGGDCRSHARRGWRTAGTPA